jgi:phosphonate transport system permease protein
MVERMQRGKLRDEVGMRFARAARRAIGLVKQAVRRAAIFVIDTAFLTYLFVMGSYVITTWASGAGVYVAVPGGFIILFALLASLLWEMLGTSIGEKAAQFLSGKASPLPEAQARQRLLRGGESLRHLSGVPWYRTLWGWSVIAAMVITLAAGTAISRVDFSKLVQNWPFAAKMLARLVRPDWTIASEVISLTLVTVFMALMATLLAIPVAVVLSFLAARNLTRGPAGRPIYFVVRALASIVRSIEPIIWAIVFVIWVRMGPFAGALALFVCSIADLTKLYSEQLESIDIGPTEAITAVGGRRLQVLLYGIVPQIINPYLSFTLYRWDINVRMGTVIGMVGGGGIGSLLMQYVRVNEWEEVSMCLVSIILVVWSIDTLSARLRARLA